MLRRKKILKTATKTAVMNQMKRHLQTRQVRVILTVIHLKKLKALKQKAHQMIKVTAVLVLKLDLKQ